MAGSTLEVTVADIAFGGKGVARAGGKALFVSGVIAGERVRVRVVADKKRFLEAELLEVLEPSPHRVTPRCPLFGLCGGCAYQHMDYGHQVGVKTKQVEETLRRIGKIDPVAMGEPVAAPEPYGYRNRIRVHAGQRAIGFYGADGQSLVDVPRCEIAAEEVNGHLGRLRQSKRMRQGDYTLSARGHLGFFEQTNDGVAARMLERVRGLVGEGGETLVDAYAGAGFFGHALAGLFRRVIGIEINAQAVASARRRARENEEYREGPVDRLLADALIGAGDGDVLLLLDPPSEGVAAQVVAAIRERPPRCILYVSCNPATLARDLAALGGVYRPGPVIAVDMFPQTAEVEVIAPLERAGSGGA